jgi:hypothetical protein
MSRLRCTSSARIRERYYKHVDGFLYFDTANAFCVETEHVKAAEDEGHFDLRARIPVSLLTVLLLVRIRAHRNVGLVFPASFACGQPLSGSPTPTPGTTLLSLCRSGT